MTSAVDDLRRKCESLRHDGECRMPPLFRIRMFLVVMSFGAGSMFLVSLDSVVDNLQPVAMPFLLNIYKSKAIADVAWEWIVSSRIYGLALGCFGALLLANCESRKWPFIGALVVNFVGGLLSAFIVYTPTNAGVMMCCAGRFACGIGCGVAQVVGSAMLAEIPPVRSRGTVLATLTVWSCLGELGGMIISLSDLLGRASTWHVALAAPSFIVPLILLFILPAPDSPRSLLIAGRRAEALAALKFYQCSADCQASLADIDTEARNLMRTERCCLRRYVGCTNEITVVVRTRLPDSKGLMNCEDSATLLKRESSDLFTSEAIKPKWSPFNGLNDSGSDSNDVDSGHHSADADGEDGYAGGTYPNNEPAHDSLSSFSTSLKRDSYSQNRGSKTDSRVSTSSKSPAILRLLASRLRSGTFVRPLAIGAFVLTFAHLDDWLWISYSTPVFESVGMSTNEAMRASLFMSLPQAAISILLLFGFDEFSRRWLLILPTLASVAIAGVGAAALFSGQKIFLGGLLPLKSLIAYLAAFDLSAAAIASESAYTVLPELFPQTDRVLGSAIIGFTQNFFGGFLSTFILSIIDEYGTQFVLLPFALMNIAYVTIIYRTLPETNGISFHKISQNFKEDLPGVCTVMYALLARLSNTVSAFATGACLLLPKLLTRFR